MTSKTLRFACAFVTLIALVLATAPAGANEANESTRSESCGRAESLRAAKEALARGDREGAIESLRRAEALLRECGRASEGTSPEQAPESTESALAFVPTAFTLLVGS
jgi:hypothetical protein